MSHHSGSCHCGTVKFSVELTEGFATARRCNCSYCRMRGAVVVSAKLQDLKILHGAEHLTRYQFNTKSAQHFFCSRCGIYTHHQRRSKPDEYGINVACLEGVSPFDFAEIPVVNGTDHPADRGASTSQVVGTLRYERK